MYAFYSSSYSCMPSVCWYFQSAARGAKYRRSSYAVFRKCKTLVTAYRLRRTSDKKNRQVFCFRHDSRRTESNICVNWEIIITISGNRKTDNQFVTRVIKNFDFMFQLNALFVYYIFSYSSTCFEQYCAHHQEDLLYIHSIWFFICHSS